MSALGRWFPDRWRQRWMGLSGRERTGLGLALLVLALGLVWSLGVAPAWRQWQQGQAQTQALQAQWQGMQALQAQASALSGQARLRPDEAARLLQSSVAMLGAGASLTLNGDMATVQLKGVSAAALSPWLAQARLQAQSLPVQARLSRSNASGILGGTNPSGHWSVGNMPGASGAAAPVGALGALAATATPTSPAPPHGHGAVLWDGQIVLQLPAAAKP